MPKNEACRCDEFLEEPNAGSLYNKRRLLQQFIFQILPRVKRLLRQWREAAEACPDQELRKQALASLKLKDFHCQGGAFFAVHTGDVQQELLRFIVAYQTVCDYLDNLCDRAGQTSGPAFLRLHQSLLAAVDANRPYQDYYEYFPEKDDGGYLETLIEECRWCLKALPSYEKVKDKIMLSAVWYTGLQVNKHLAWDVRESILKDWVNQYLPAFPGLMWNEWAAAAGSTLALFAMLRLSCQKHLDCRQVQATWDVYFPGICALHILLDYFIDQEEDREGHDLNFTFYYRSEEEMAARLKQLIREARDNAALLPDKVFHQTVVEGLLAMYLSDAKVERLGLEARAREMINECGGQTRSVFLLCNLVRKFL